MRKISIILILAACLLFSASAVTAQKAKNTMTNTDVVEMVKAGLPESMIVLAIQQSEPNFDTSTKALIELSKQGVSQKIVEAMLQPPATKSVLQNKTDTANAVVSKDIGSLRVVLKSITPVKLSGQWGGNGIRCAFEFINLETQRPIVVAMNAVAPDPYSRRIGSFLRSTLVDENGGMWRLRNSQVAGMSIVGVGQQSYEGLYDPSEIVTALSRRDDIGLDFAGTQNQNFRFIYGATTEMSPGQSLTVTMSFVQVTKQTNSDSPPKFFQMATEIVVGIVKTGTKKSYSLYNLTFDRVSPFASNAPVLSTTVEGNNSGSISPGTIRKNSIGMELVYIPPGTFMMGSIIGGSGEKPVQTVTISQGFWMGRYEVTQGQWEQVMGTTLRQQLDKGILGAFGAPGEGADYPMYSVSWEEAKEFVRRMNQKSDGFEYSLPSEAQWEYAARAGTTGATYGKLDSIAWYGQNSDGTTHPVGTKKPNAFGLYDMLGNVWEWCEDRYGSYSDGAVTDPKGASNGEERVLRGGSWQDGGISAAESEEEFIMESRIRSAVRQSYGTSHRDNITGFRIAARLR